MSNDRKLINTESIKQANDLLDFFSVDGRCIRLERHAYAPELNNLQIWDENNFDWIRFDAGRMVALNSAVILNLKALQELKNRGC